MGALKKIQGFLGDRMSDRMKPKAVGVEVSVEKKPMEEGSLEEEKMESPQMESQESAGMGAAQKIAEDLGGDASKLEPDEQAELERLYHKMGC